MPPPITFQETSVMNRFLTGTAAVLIVYMTSTVALAKRSAPPEVPPERHGSLEYRVKHETGNGDMPGIVEAWDTARRRRVWFRQI
jgi:hypothetical protein